MVADELSADIYEGKEHQAAYIFDPADEVADGGDGRPSKRRKVSKKQQNHTHHDVLPASTTRYPLLEGTENEESIRLRTRAFEDAWSQIDKRIQRILREANQSTLDEVTSFIQGSSEHVPNDKIPSAFIITGPNIASQDLLFDQMADALQTRAKTTTVRLRSGDASNLKAILKKIIHDVTASTADEGDDLEVAVGKDKRKYLNYDLEALYAHLRSTPRNHVAIAFQDSEAFDSGLLSDLISLLSSWLDRIPFVFVFGVATSVELFQARLLKSTCQCLHGDQFDVEQSASIIDRVFKTAIAHAHASLRLGPSFVHGLLERQREQVASIPMFVNSLKYAYMCHFYANPLTVFLSLKARMSSPQSGHFEALRSLPSFRQSVEAAIESSNVKHAKLLMDDDGYLITHLQDCLRKSQQWVVELLRTLKYLTAGKASTSSDFSQLYLDAVRNGVQPEGKHAEFLESVKQMQPSDAIFFLTQVVDAINKGDQALGLSQWANEDEKTTSLLSAMLAEVKDLQSKADEDGHALRSQYSGQSKVLRTTVIAQKVQLSQDTAALTDHDKAYTKLIDRLVAHLQKVLSCERAEDMPFHEIWLYDSKAPYKDVFMPRPRAVVERALSRPHDYLGCSCCKAGEGQIASTLPTTSILYQLYLETGSLVNVADLWSAYLAIVGDENEEGLDERTALVLFYQGLAELRVMGFVKPSRKKADHIAKLAWKGL